MTLANSSLSWQLLQMALPKEFQDLLAAELFQNPKENNPSGNTNDLTHLIETQLREIAPGTEHV